MPKSKAMRSGKRHEARQSAGRRLRHIFGTPRWKFQTTNGGQTAQYTPQILAYQWILRIFQTPDLAGKRQSQTRQKLYREVSGQEIAKVGNTALKAFELLHKNTVLFDDTFTEHWQREKWKLNEKESLLFPMFYCSILLVQ